MAAAAWVDVDRNAAPAATAADGALREVVVAGTEVVVAGLFLDHQLAGFAHWPGGEWVGVVSCHVGGCLVMMQQHGSTKVLASILHTCRPQV